MRTQEEHPNRPTKISKKLSPKNSKDQNSHHQNRSSSNEDQNPEMDEKKTVFMIGLPTTTNHSYFNSWIREKLPNLKFKKIKFPKSKEKGAFAFIEFEDEESKIDILSLPHLVFRNRELKFQPYRTGEQLERYREGVQQRRLYVYGLKPQMDKKDLRKIFSEFGRIDDAYIIYHRDTGVSKCFGYVIFEDVETAKEVASIGELDFYGVTIRFKMHESKKRKNVVKSSSFTENPKNFVNKKKIENVKKEKKSKNKKNVKNPQVAFGAEYYISIEYQKRRFFDNKLSLKQNQINYRRLIDFQSLIPTSTQYFRERGRMKHFEQNLEFRQSDATGNIRI